MDTTDLDAAARFWTALLGTRVVRAAADWIDLEPLGDGGPTLAFQLVPEQKEIKNRLHLDLATADVKGNEFCLVTT